MIFDSDSSKIGQKVGEYTIEDASKMVERIRTEKVKLAMVTVPASTAQEVADKLVQAGIKAILNYAPTSINVPKNVRVQYIDPATHLQRMTYYLD
jgi:redox-sensing transcriptional repressor